MKSCTTERFRKALRVLPARIHREARDAYRLFEQDSYHPALRFKQVHPAQPIYSVRISRDYRALGRVEGEDVIWFWIGSHADYDKLLTQL